MPELIEHGTNGFLIDDAPQAMGAVEHVGSLNRADVRDTVLERFSVDRMAEDYIAMYHRILTGPPHSLAVPADSCEAVA